jgi:GAF domain-containing protein
MNHKSKKNRYERIIRQLEGIIGKTEDRISRMATIASVLYHKMNTYYWVGFYRLIRGQLIIGPYQGTLACQVLPKDTGVCWALVNRKETVIVGDVHQFAGHIACDPRSRSEIVVPCKDKRGKIFAVLDIDSDRLNAFDEADAACLEKIVKLLNV